MTAPVKIVVNARLAVPGRLDGIGWFSYQSLTRMARAHREVKFVWLFDQPPASDFSAGDNVEVAVRAPRARHPFLSFYWMQFAVKPLLDELKPDLFLALDGVLALGAGCKQLAVIHDLNFLHHPGDLPFWVRRYYNRFFPRFAREAVRIATVSDFSKRDIVSSYGIAPGLVDVVPNGINEHFQPVDETTKARVKRRFTDGRDYFLFVGSISRRKNLARLIGAFARFKAATSSTMKLVIAGAFLWQDGQLLASIKKLKLEGDVIFTGRIGDEELRCLTGSAFALTYVSYFEGVGLPVLEAMQCGVPVIAAGTTSLPEVAGDAAIYADPFDEHAIHQAMTTLFADPALRADLIERGFARKREFSWDKTASLLWQSIAKAVPCA